jgi:DNA-binding transcriptional LysR family regulator
MRFDPDLTDLRLLVQVLEAGSITAGASASHLSTSSASARLAALEQALGQPLLRRGPRGVAPTAAGLTLAEHARAVLAQTAQLRGAMAELRQPQAPPVRLMGTTAALREHLPEALGVFLTRHPAINLQLAEAQSAHTVAALQAGQADLGIVSDDTALHGLQAQRLVFDPLALAVPRGHPLVQAAAGQPVTMAQADACDAVGLLRGSAMQDTRDARAAERGATLNYRVRVASFDAQARLVERGVGVALMPRATATRFARTMAIDVLPLDHPFMNRWLLLCCRSSAELTRAAQCLWQALGGPD